MKFYIVLGFNLEPYWASSWNHLGSDNRRRAVLNASQDAFGSQNTSDPPNGSKMKPPSTQNDAPDRSFWIEFGVNFKYV